MGFGKTLKLRKKSESQREVRQTRQLHQEEPHWKRRVMKTSSSLIQLKGSSSFEFSASAGNGRRAKREHEMFLTSRLGISQSQKQSKLNVKSRGDKHAFPKRRKPPLKNWCQKEPVKIQIKLFWITKKSNNKEPGTKQPRLLL